MKRKVTEYVCDNPVCGEAQTGELTDGVYGLGGRVEEHTPSGGAAGIDWFACSRACVSPAISAAIDAAYDRNNGFYE